jgi:hypothetical protein
MHAVGDRHGETPQAKESKTPKNHQDFKPFDSTGPYRYPGLYPAFGGQFWTPISPRTWSELQAGLIACARRFRAEILDIGSPPMSMFVPKWVRSAKWSPD